MGRLLRTTALKLLLWSEADSYWNMWEHRLSPDQTPSAGFTIFSDMNGEAEPKPVLGAGVEGWASDTKGPLDDHWLNDVSANFVRPLDCLPDLKSLTSG